MGLADSGFEVVAAVADEKTIDEECVGSLASDAAAVDGAVAAFVLALAVAAAH